MDPHEEYIESLPSQAVQLVILQRVLYEGSWDDMVTDLVARRDGRPFIYKLQSRIEEDLDRIERLREYERQHGVRLSEYVGLKDPPEERKAQ